MIFLTEIGKSMIVSMHTLCWCILFVNAIWNTTVIFIELN